MPTPYHKTIQHLLFCQELFCTSKDIQYGNGVDIKPGSSTGWQQEVHEATLYNLNLSSEHRLLSTFHQTYCPRLLLLRTTRDEIHITTHCMVILPYFYEHNLHYFTLYLKSDKPIKAVICHLPINISCRISLLPFRSWAMMS